MDRISAARGLFRPSRLAMVGRLIQAAWARTHLFPKASGGAGSFDRVAQRYTGTTAADYEGKRAHGVKWQTESAIVERLLTRLPAGRTLLDIPVGTGRFLGLYDRMGIAATGMDVSDDMLSVAREKKATAALRLGDIRRIDAKDAEYDCALCIRFLNWVDSNELEAALRELARVSRDHVIVSVSVYSQGGTRTLLERGRRRVARWMALDQPVLTIHEPTILQQAIRTAGLHVRSAERVQRNAAASVDYNIYHLVKSGSSSDAQSEGPPVN